MATASEAASQTKFNRQNPLNTRFYSRDAGMPRHREDAPVLRRSFWRLRDCPDGGCVLLGRAMGAIRSSSLSKARPTRRPTWTSFYHNGLDVETDADVE